jgi:hypothetical protein
MQMLKRFITATGLLALLAMAGCEETNRSHAVYMLVDISGTYTREVERAEPVAGFVLAKLYPGDRFGLATIDSDSYSQENIVFTVNLDDRPSYATRQKEEAYQRLQAFVEGVDQGSQHTDITGGILQGAEWLRETDAGQRTMLLFSDMREDLPEGYIRDIEMDLSGVRVVAINVLKLRGDNIDPRLYRDRLAAWEQRVTEAGGEWMVINDLEQLEPVMAF